eukprot:GSChrysophyteH1.ASY1.ANO1.1075.1 assembled CDS
MLRVGIRTSLCQFRVISAGYSRDTAIRSLSTKGSDVIASILDEKAGKSKSKGKSAARKVPTAEDFHKHYEANDNPTRPNSDKPSSELLESLRAASAGKPAPSSHVSRGSSIKDLLGKFSVATERKPAASSRFSQDVSAPKTRDKIDFTGATLRSALRNTAASRLAGTPDVKSHSHNKKTVAQERDNILGSLERSLPTSRDHRGRNAGTRMQSNNDAISLDPSLPMEEPTSGEERYQRHLENQRRKKMEQERLWGGDPYAGRYRQHGHKEHRQFEDRQRSARLQAAPQMVADEKDGKPRMMTMAEQIKLQQEKLARDREKNKLKQQKLNKEGLTVRELGQRMNGDAADPGDIVIDSEVAELIVLTLDDSIDVRRESISVKSDKKRETRDPVVCVMGHVDHGKTSLLDSLRKASVAASEAGGITQRLSAFCVNLPSANNRQVVFLDTPGHAAFSTMRSHGVSATDLVVLVVAIDDGVKTQTKEALRTAKEAGCNIIVALNKCDKFDGDPVAKAEARARVLSQLVEQELVAEDYGGDIMVVETAALSGAGLDDLVEGIALQADMLELQAAHSGQCEAVVLDANIEKGRGVVADVLVRWGELQVGDSIVVDTMFGKVKAMVDDKGKKLKKAGPSTPVRVLGLRSVPTAGQELLSVDSETKAREISGRRQRVKDLRALRKQQHAASGSDVPILEVVLKADGVGTLEALNQVVMGLDARTEELKLRIVDEDVGDITRGDVETASTSNAVVLGFNVGVADSTTRAMAKEHDVSIARDNVIYRLEEKLVNEMQAVMPMERVEHVDGVAVVQEIFQLNTKAKDQVAGLLVESGFLTKKAQKASFPLGFKGVVFREEVINDDTVTLRRFKDVVNTVENGNECGISLVRFRDWREGDVIECYRIETRRKKLVLN